MDVRESLSARRSDNKLGLERRVQNMEHDPPPERVPQEAEALDVERLLDGLGDEEPVPRVAEVGLLQAKGLEPAALRAELPDVRGANRVAPQEAPEDHALELAGAVRVCALVVGGEGVLECALLRARALPLGPDVQLVDVALQDALRDKPEQPVGLGVWRWIKTNGTGEKQIRPRVKRGGSVARSHTCDKRRKGEEEHGTRLSIGMRCEKVTSTGRRRPREKDRWTHRFAANVLAFFIAKPHLWVHVSSEFGPASARNRKPNTKCVHSARRPFLCAALPLRRRRKRARAPAERQHRCHFLTKREEGKGGSGERAKKEAKKGAKGTELTRREGEGGG